MIDRADAQTMEGTANLMVELRAGLDAAATEIGAEKLLLSVREMTRLALTVVCRALWERLELLGYPKNGCGKSAFCKSGAELC
jgi:hypothetical protein